LENLWEEEWHKNLLAAAVERVKSKISPKQFLLFDLYALKQTPARTISSAMGVSLGQVYLAKHRVARLLQHELRVLEQGQDCP
jgi:RNA polymerase sigma-70 factor (ECF subfamily)